MILNSIKRVFARALILLIAFFAFGMDPLSAQDLVEEEGPPRLPMVERYLIPSTISFGGGYDTAKPEGGYNELWFEADLNQHLHFQPPFFKNRAFIKVNPRVRLRMLALESSPVKTPSFMPNITLFYGLSQFQETYKEAGLTYFSLMLSHHSNGQSGDFYLEDGSINTENGSFSTNFFEFGVNRIWGGKGEEAPLWQAWSRLSLIWHPGFNLNDELDDQYEVLKVALVSNTTRGREYNFELQSYVSYVLLGMDYTFIPGPGSALPRKEAEWYDRSNWGVIFSLGNKKIGDFRWFIRYDHGYDYYNIHFSEPIRRFQFGIMGDPF